MYKILLLPARLALHFYCRTIRINRPEYLRAKGPLLLAANHPNSFLDAIIMASLFRHPIVSLARGDAFASPLIVRLLHSMNILPVYRISEGAENLKENYDTFSRVHELLRQNSIVLIFSEGRCVNEWHLRPLKKGTARIALQAWSEGIALRILPAGINYSNFGFLGKDVTINFGRFIESGQPQARYNGKDITAFTHNLKEALSPLVYEIDRDDHEAKRKVFASKHNPLTKGLLFVPAVAGYLLHAPLYFAAHLMIRKRANVHYDSILVGILFLFYPVYLLLIVFLFWHFTGSVFMLTLFALMPATALALLHFRPVIR